MRSSRAVAVLVLMGGCLWGCRGEVGDGFAKQRPSVVSAKGTITYQGTPLVDAVVVFSPTNGTHAAAARTDGKGRFVMQAFPPNDGVVPGTYKVSIVKHEEPADATSPQQGDADEPRQTPAPRLLTPKKYAIAEQSGLSVQIPHGGKDDITLSLEG